MGGDKIMILSEVLHETKMGKTKLYSLMKNGRFPKQRLHGIGSVVWVRSEVEHWIDCVINEVEYREKQVA
jgi:prophage regulatory protein